MEKFKKSLIFVCLLFFSGCASVQDVGISSIPDGAHFVVSLADGRGLVTEGVTPSVVTLKRKHAYVIRFEKEGYESGNAALISKRSIASDAGPIIWAIQAHTGADRKLVPESVHIELGPQQVTVLLYAPPPKEIKAE